MSSLKFNICDQVTNLKLGLPVVGEIIGYVIGGGFLQYLCADLNYNEYDDIYPGWQESIIYCIMSCNGECFWFPEDDLINIEENDLE